ncbi:MAG: Hsp20/alpha crystallin family protein [Pirellulaceae bacterium]|jgi:HSP20 family protein|nr:Hsp20/alpha crystallin family protein [Planctomycetaceae bacterium]HIM31884.1 Hsp20/alpha crystallin family protein [Planctomycetota bacterium]
MAQELISSRFARLFDDAFTTTETTRSSVPVDLAEWEDRFELQFDVPGVRSEDVSIEYQEGSLTISGNRQITPKDGCKLHHRERRTGKFQRVFSIQRDIDVDAISASNENGVLTVILPKSDRARPRKIEILRN